LLCICGSAAIARPLSERAEKVAFALTTPQEVLARPSLVGAITVSWKPVTGAVAYDVEYSNTGAPDSFRKLATVTSASYRHEKLYYSQKVYYRVRAVNSGETSPYSTVVNATTHQQGKVYNILPLGDSNTEGVNSTNGPVEERVAYRARLEDLLDASNSEGRYDFVGSQKTGSALMNDTDHAGFGGARDEDIAMLLKEGKFSFYGSTTDFRGPGLEPGQEGYLDAYNPDVILLHIGTNWVWDHPVDASDVSDILNLIDDYEARAKKEVTVVLAKIILSDGQDSKVDTDTKTYNDAVKVMAEERVAAGDRIVFVDMQEGADIIYKRTEEGGDMADQLHLNEQGYNKMALVWFQALDPLLNVQPQKPDAEVPETFIASGPEKLSGKRSATFTFTSDETGVTYEVKVDNAGFTEAASSYTANNLADGEHTLQVRATDAAGNTDSSPASYTWVIDTEAPAVPVVAAPANGAVLATNKPAISGTAEAGSTVTVSVDAVAIGSVAATNGSWSFVPATALADGTHTVAAKATDAVGNSSSGSNPKTFTVDATTPDTKIEEAPPALTNSKTASFDFSSNRQNVTFEARLDNAAFAVVSDPFRLENLPDGRHTLTVRAKNQAGTVDPSPASHTWTVDTQAPGAPVVAAPAEGAVLNTNKPALTGTAEAGSKVTLYRAGSTLGTVTPGEDGRWRFVPADALAEGVQQLTAKATDAAGNTGSASGTRRFTVDTQAPETTVAAGPAAVTNTPEAQFSFRSNERGVSYWASVDGAAFAQVENPYIIKDLSDGAHSIAVRARDTAGNSDASPATHSWMVDTRAPGAPAITAVSEDRGPAANDKITSDNTVRLAGTAEANAVVHISASGEALGTTKATQAGNWEFNYEGTALAQGTYQFTATATDAAGNTGTASAAFAVTIDLTAPEMRISKAAGAPLNAAFTIEIKFSEAVYNLTAADFAVTNGVVSDLSATDRAAYMATVTPTGDGRVQVALPAGKTTDLAGNTNIASNLLETTYDATRPRVVLSSDAPAAVNVPFTVTFTFSEAVTGFDVSDLRMTNATAGDFATVNANTYTTLLTPATDGEVSISVAADKASDAAGNGNEASAVMKRVYDVQRPAAVLSTIAPNPTKAPFTVTVSFSEPVKAFAAANLHLTNADASQITNVNDHTYTAMITPRASGEVAVALPANEVQDMAANGNQSSNKLRLRYDADRPAVTLTTTAPALTNAPFTVTFSISEAITGFALADIASTNATAENLQKVAEQEYTVHIRPTGDGKVTVSVPADKMQDAAANGNTASILLERTYDATAPAGYSVRFGVNLVDVTNQHAVALQLKGAETGATYTYSIRSSNGGDAVTGTARVNAASFTISDLDLSGLRDGLLTVSLYLTDAAGNEGAEAVAQVEKLTKNIELVEDLAPLKVKFKTAFNDIPLPKKVEVTYTNGEKDAVKVTWEAGTYKANVPGRYMLAGVLELKENTSNLGNKTASITVEVEPNQAPTALTLSQNTFQPDIEPNELIGTFATADPDDADFIYALVAGEGSEHNQLFEISNGNELKLKSNKGLSGVAAFTIRVRSTDPYKNFIEQTFTLAKSLYQPKDKIKLVNAFSPDGDGTNDTWIVPELRYYNQVEVEVFDRAGTRLFHTTNPEEGWDGRSADGRILQGSYFYIIQVKDINLVQKGVVTVLN